jgi:hypothetical protein
MDDGAIEVEVIAQLSRDGSGRRRKVAFVIISVAEALGKGDEEPFLDRVASAIDRLVTSGQPESWGDISDWRHSEVKLAEVPSP